MECVFGNTSYLEITHVPNVFQPGEKREVEIRFYPRELKHYFEQIPFEINGLSMTNIEIDGQGVEMRVGFLIYLLFLPLVFFFLVKTMVINKLREIALLAKH